MCLTAWVAQLVEHFPEEEGVGGSSPPLSTHIENTTLRRVVFSICVRKGSKAGCEAEAGQEPLSILNL